MLDVRVMHRLGDTDTYLEDRDRLSLRRALVRGIIIRGLELLLLLLESALLVLELEVSTLRVEVGFGGSEGTVEWLRPRSLVSAAPLLSLDSTTISTKGSGLTPRSHDGDPPLS